MTRAEAMREAKRLFPNASAWLIGTTRPWTLMVGTAADFMGGRLREVGRGKTYAAMIAAASRKSARAASGER